ncbi:MAG TPA: dihydroorotate dehydrogenase [bacterium]|nr:dihydroorotate dehydrogenase [bacterium]
MSNVDMTVRIGDLTLNNPVLVSSGTFGYGQEFADFIDLNKLGGIITKAITPKPRAGNPPPRIIETPAGVLNAIGLENCGLDVFIKDKLPYLKDLSSAIVVNVAGACESDYVEVVSSLSKEDGVDAFEINISCPNVKQGGIEFGTDAGRAGELVEKLRASTKLPLIIKLSPNVADVCEIAAGAEAAGADAFSLVNTYRGMAIDIAKERPVLGNKIGGLSGPAIKPLALYQVWKLYQSTKLPIIGMGGIMNHIDAIEFIYAGASAVSVGTANFIDPSASVKIVDGISTWLAEKSPRGFEYFIGRAHRT